MISALYVHPDTVYHALGLDCWDQKRDARNWPGGNPCIAHPPCGQWGKLRGLANNNPEEKDLAKLAVRQVRENGGVLEHPEFSTLWTDQGLPLPGSERDKFGGWSLSVNQSWFGFPARKGTWLYIVGIAPTQLPDYSPNFMAVTHGVTSLKRRKAPGVPEMPKKMRAVTVPQFAWFLTSIAWQVFLSRK